MTNQEIIISILGAIGGTGLMGGGWWFKRWMNRVDTTIDKNDLRIEKKLEKIMESLKNIEIAVAVQDSQKEIQLGSVSQLQQSVNTTNQDIGKLNGSIQKLWEVVSQTTGNVGKRFSDNRGGSNER